LEQYSRHPIARAICREYVVRPEFQRNFTEVYHIDGKGIRAKDIHDNTYEFFSYRHSSLENQQHFDLVLLINQELKAGLVIEDEISENAKDLIQFFREKNIQTILLSGDRRSKCEKLATTLAIGTVYFEKLPQQKRLILQEIKRQGKTVYLDHIQTMQETLEKEADLSLAISTAGTHNLQNRPSISILNTDLSTVQQLFRLSKQLIRKTNQNTVLFLLYNLLVIPCSILGYLNPFTAVLSLFLFTFFSLLRSKVKC